MHILTDDIVLIYGPACFTYLFEIYISSLVKKSIKKVTNKEELKSLLTNESSRVSLAILFNIYPSFENDNEVIGLIENVRRRDRKRFPIVVLALTKPPHPVFEVKGHKWFKLPASLQELRSHICSQESLEEYELNVIINKHFSPAKYLSARASSFNGHGLEKIKQPDTTNFLTEFRAFKEDFFKISGNKDIYFRQNDALLGSIDNIDCMIRELDTLELSNQTSAQKNSFHEKIKNALSDLIGKANEVPNG